MKITMTQLVELAARFTALLAMIAMLLPGPANSDILTPFPVMADPILVRHQPALDFDKDGCLQTAALEYLTYKLNVGEDAHFKFDLDSCTRKNRVLNANTYAHYHCNDSKWCALMYAY